MKSEKHQLYFGKSPVLPTYLGYIANAVLEVYVKYQIEVV